MSEAKYKVGDEVRVPDIETPLTIVAVETCYKFSPVGALWREEELTPYVKPLAVGDRVRAGIRTGTVRHVEGGEACWLSDSGNGLHISIIADLERIPTEAGQ